MAAAYSAGPDNPHVAGLEKFINLVGLAFQIRDDILDIEGDTEIIGKQQGADIERSKATWPALFGLEEARTQATDLLNEALAAIADIGSEADPLRDVARYIVNRSF